MDYTVIPYANVFGDWRVERTGTNEVTIFSGNDARERAEHYANRMNSVAPAPKITVTPVVPKIIVLPQQHRVKVSKYNFTARKSAKSICKSKLVCLRNEKGLSQMQLAALAGVCHLTISSIERGQTKSAKYKTVQRLCLALGINESELCT